MQFFVGIGTLKVISLRFEGINGWSFEGIAFMYGLSIVSYGLVVVFLSQSWQTEFYIRWGHFDRILTRPLNVRFQFLMLRVSIVGLTDLLPGVIIFTYGIAATRLPLTPRHILYLLCAIAGGVLIRSGIYTCIGSLAFWTKSNRPLIKAANALFGQIVMYPLTIFNRAMQALLTFALPLGFVAFYPAAELLHKPTGFALPGALSLWSLGAGAMMTTLGRLVFKLGLRRYDSVGN
jgi:ABC-2 type transport system permease protein